MPFLRILIAKISAISVSTSKLLSYQRIPKSAKLSLSGEWSIKKFSENCQEVVNKSRVALETKSSKPTASKKLSKSSQKGIKKFFILLKSSFSVDILN